MAVRVPRRTSNDERQRGGAMREAVARKPPRMTRSDAFSCCRRAACSTRLSLCANATAVAASRELMRRCELVPTSVTGAFDGAQSGAGHASAAARSRRKPCGAGRHDHEKRERRRVTSGWGWGRHAKRTTPTRPLFRRFAGAAFFRPAEPGFRSERAAALPELNLARAATQAASGSFTLRRRTPSGPARGGSAGVRKRDRRRLRKR